jgi:hypothetical protein
MECQIFILQGKSGNNLQFLSNLNFHFHVDGSFYSKILQKQNSQICFGSIKKFHTAKGLSYCYIGGSENT